MNPTRLRLYFTALVFLAELAHLAWEHFHGGIRSHHVLNRENLPAISNAWGALWLPALTWSLIGRIQSRLALSHSTTSTELRTSPKMLSGFSAALLFGLSLAVAFTNGNEAIASYLFLGMFLLALLLPVYRAECVLGFVLAMTFTFGAVLPTLIACVISIISATVHLGIIPAVARAWTRLQSKRAQTP
jgi:hypothetical protein